MKKHLVDMINMGWFYLKREICTKDIYRQVVGTKQSCLKQSLEVLHFVFIEIIYNISLPLFVHWKKLYPDEKWTAEFNFSLQHLESYRPLLQLTNEVYAAKMKDRFRTFCVEAVQRWISILFQNVLAQNTLEQPSEQTVDHFQENIDGEILSYYADLFEDAINYKWEKLMIARAYVLHVQSSERMLYKPKRFNQL